MSTFFKEGVVGDLQIVVVKCKGRIARLYQSEGLDLMITSKRDGNHSLGSLHPDGWAFDFRQLGVELSEIKEAAGKGFDVVRSNHGAVHVEYDPK